MGNNKFVVIDVNELTPKQLELKMNELNSQGYERAFQSNIEWYQGVGVWGVITFELKEEH